MPLQYQHKGFKFMITEGVAVVGCGVWGLNLVRIFQALGALTMLYDPLPERRVQAAQIAPGVACAETYAQVLEAPIQAIVLATPAATHAELGRHALLAGKDLLIEKPLALGYQQGRELVLLAEECKRILMVGHVFEYHPAVVRMLQLANSGELGELRYISSTRLSPGPIRSDTHVLWCPALHDIGLVLHLAGSAPEQVSANGGSYYRPPLADIAHIDLRFKGGLWAHIAVSWLHPFKERQLMVMGSQGAVCFDDVAGTLTYYRLQDEVQAGRLHVASQGEQLSYSAEEPLRLECEAFLDAIRTRRPPRTDGQSCLQGLRVLEAAQLSLETI